MKRIRTAIDARVADLTGRRQSVIDYARPANDPGLFGPGSAVWRVHGDFTAMLCGGIGALLLQMLHPLALAGVWDHSNFRADMLGRLRRTSQFIAVTTYGSTTDALAAIERVKRIHLGVEGIAPDGRHYSASDPELLTWVHVAETSCFLAAHLRYRDPALPTQVQDRYYAESARIALALGARQVPASRIEVEEYLRQMRAELVCDDRTREVARLLLAAGPDDFLTKHFGRLFKRAGLDLLPDWATTRLGLRLGFVQRQAVRTSVRTLAPLIRYSVRGTASERAKQRMKDASS